MIRDDILGIQILQVYLAYHEMAHEYE